MIQTKNKKPSNLEKYLGGKSKIKIISCNKDNLCSALTTKGKNCSRKRLPNSEFCKLHKTKKEKREIYVKWLKENNPNISSEIPTFLTPYTDENMSPNEIKLIYGDKPNRAEYIKFYGEYNGHPFTEQDLINDKKNIKNVCCIHDANHSVALFLKTKDRCQFAFHNYIPFVFPGSKEYVKMYCLKFGYPLVISKVKANIDDLLIRNGCPKAMGRFCTRIFKIEASYWFYLCFYNLNFVIQYLGITNDTPKRASKYPKGVHESKLSQKKKGFKIYNHLPIRNFLSKEQEILIKEHGLPLNPIKEKYGDYGCIYCAMRSELYYYKLREWFPDLYEKCLRWRKLGSSRSKKDYYYYPNSQIM